MGLVFVSNCTGNIKSAFHTHDRFLVPESVLGFVDNASIRNGLQNDSISHQN